MNQEEFEGDVLLTDTVEGGEIQIVNGLIMPDRSFSTALYLSLFGGNTEDGGKVDNNKTWWGNRLENTKQNEKIVSKFQSFIRVMPLTSKNLVVAKETVIEDLNWMVEERVADEIQVDIKAVDNNRIELIVIIKKDNSLVTKGNWTVNWEASKNGI